MAMCHISPLLIGSAFFSSSGDEDIEVFDNIDNSENSQYLQVLQKLLWFLFYWQALFHITDSALKCILFFQVYDKDAYKVPELT